MNNIDKLIESGTNIRIEISPQTLKEFGNELAETVVKGTIEAYNHIAEQEKEGYITGEKVCELLNISRGTLWKWDKKGITKPIRIGNLKRYRLSDLRALGDLTVTLKKD